MSITCNDTIGFREEKCLAAHLDHPETRYAGTLMSVYCGRCLSNGKLFELLCVAYSIFSRLFSCHKMATNHLQAQLWCLLKQAPCMIWWFNKLRCLDEHFFPLPHIAGLVASHQVESADGGCYLRADICNTLPLYNDVCVNITVSDNRYRGNSLLNPLKCSVIRWLYLKLFNAIQV